MTRGPGLTARPPPELLTTRVVEIRLTSFQSTKTPIHAPAKGKTMSETTKATENDVLDLIRFQLDWWTRQGVKAREAVAADGNSDWALMEDLAKSYGFAPVIHELQNILDRVEEGRFTLMHLLEKTVERTQADLNRTRLNNSTSAAANLIGVEKMYAKQALLEAASGWLLVAKALQPAE